MDFVIKKTTELTELEQYEILNLFNRIFKKERTIEQFQDQFFNTVLGYSYHSIILDDKQIVGCYSCIPAYYTVVDKRYLFTLAVDNMISKEYRGLVYFYRMVTAINDYMRKEGIAFVHAFPNDIAYPVFVKTKLMQDIGSLITYCLPYRIGGIKPQLRALNWLSVLFVNCYVFLMSVLAGKKIHHFSIEKEAITYNATRYKRLDGNYNTANYKGSEFVYKLMDYEGIRSAFLIDVFEKSAANFNKAVRYIIKNHRKEFDVLLYVGYLPFRFHGLIQIPQKLTPKNFHFTGEILQKDVIDKDVIFDIGNWDVNLSNYDLL
jgi:hypothetical protein